MISKAKSSALLGIDAYIVDVEVDIAPGLPMFSTVGLPDTAVKESKDRVKAAVKNSGFGFPSNEALEAAITFYSELGMKVMVTELDISVLPDLFANTGADIAAMQEMRENYNLYPDGLPDEIQQKLAKRYAELFSIFHKHSDKISRITFWGVYDGTSWRNNWPVRGSTDYPLLFDRNYKPKPAFNAVVNVVKGDKQAKCSK